jgi:CheY-like chemotaxis protein
MLSLRLSEFGFKDIQTFESGEEGLEALNKKPDVILLDFSLQGINGLDTLKIIKENRPGTTVIVLTGVKDDDLATKCLANGAADYLIKEEKSFLEIKNILTVIKKKKKVSLMKMIFGLVIVLLFVLLTIFLI